MPGAALNHPRLRYWSDVYMTSLQCPRRPGDLRKALDIQYYAPGERSNTLATPYATAASKEESWATDGQVHRYRAQRIFELYLRVSFQIDKVGS
ncbi:hypothetical protein PoB_002890100 [Plakobranchus ocellatus]|uniref:Uncharacterized protein n=1 Tax=Plakobranchus ocellatus TaxID=259542 RepID=A0AAV3ZTS4_9GAST|nr:hypothetical protein PoB_002890100 [Plakobranchus ocellatus]